MQQEMPRSVILPYSKATIRFTSDYNKEKLADFTRQLVIQEELALEMRRDPIKALAGLGIEVTDEDRKKIKDEDILAAMGHGPLRDEAGSEVALLPVVIVIVAVINFPQPAE